MLGGFVQANLDYHNVVRQFDFSGGQVGAYATYLKGGLFVDTLFNAISTSSTTTARRASPTRSMPTTLGMRTDTGYRFGGLRGGPFIEPLATLEVTWANMTASGSAATPSPSTPIPMCVAAWDSEPAPPCRPGPAP